MNKTTTMIGIIAVSLLLTGCQTVEEGQRSSVAPPSLPPNYDTPESAFVQVKLSALASEFLDEYAGRYVVVDGRFFNTYKGALIYSPSGRPFNVPGLMTAMIGSPEIISGRNLSVVWSQHDRELGRPFVDCAVQTPVRIYGYVLPANQQAQLKSRPEMKLNGLPTPVVLLIKAVPGASQ